jgi:hypothetical protein
MQRGYFNHHESAFEAQNEMQEWRVVISGLHKGGLSVALRPETQWV